MKVKTPDYISLVSSGLLSLVKDAEYSVLSINPNADLNINSINVKDLSVQDTLSINDAVVKGKLYITEDASPKSMALSQSSASGITSWSMHMKEGNTSFGGLTILNIGSANAVTLSSGIGGSLLLGGGTSNDSKGGASLLYDGLHGIRLLYNNDDSQYEVNIDPKTNINGDLAVSGNVACSNLTGNDLEAKSLTLKFTGNGVKLTNFGSALLSYGSIVPYTTSVIDLGSASLSWKTVYAQGITLTESVNSNSVALSCDSSSSQLNIDGNVKTSYSLYADGGVYAGNIVQAGKVALEGTATNFKIKYKPSTTVYDIITADTTQLSCSVNFHCDNIVCKTLSGPSLSVSSGTATIPIGSLILARLHLAGQASDQPAHDAGATLSISNTSAYELYPVTLNLLGAVPTITPGSPYTLAEACTFKLLTSLPAMSLNGTDEALALMIRVS